LNKERRTARPRRVVAVPTGWSEYWTFLTTFGVALRLNDPAVLRTGCRIRRTGLGRNPRMKLIDTPFRGA
jgi:hypothetical protein